MDTNAPNPYSAPQRDLVPSLGDTQGGQPMPWEPTEVLGAAWELFKQNAGLLIGAYLVAGLVVFVPGFALNFGAGFIGAFIKPASGPLAILIPVTTTLFAMVVQYALQAFIMVGGCRLCLAVVRGEPAEIGMIFSGGSRMLTMLGALIMTGLACGLGLILLIVPGVILYLGLANWLFFAADTEMGPVEVLRASWDSLNGSKLNMLVYVILGFLVLFLGVLACFVGLLVAIPVYFLGLAIIYTRTSGRMGSPQPALAV